MKSLLCICLVMLFAILVFGDTWQETTTADFTTGTATNTQVINDSVQMSGASGGPWWNPAENWCEPSTSPPWWDANYQYRKAITIDNKNTSALSDYQVKIENPVYNETGLAGSWHFEENTGTNAGDSSGYWYNGTLNNNPVWTDGRFGKGLIFNGLDTTSGNYVAINNSLTNGWPQVTLEAWLKPDGFASYKGIITKNTLAGGGTNQLGLELNSTGTVTFRADTSGTFVQTTSTTALQTTGEWYHIVGTYDGSNLRIYINGNLDGMPTARTGNLLSLTAQLWIGGQNNASGNYSFNGLIDEARIYNRALSPAEIKAHYNAKAKLNYGDIRFVNSAGTAELPYWMEKDGTFWVKADSLPVGLSNIHLYYGNSSAVSASSFENTRSSQSYSYNGNTGLIGEWRMEEASASHGSAISDTSGQGNAGTLSSGDGTANKITSGKYGNALEFDGINDYVEVLSSAYRFQSGDFSVTLWADAYVLDGSYDGLITTDIDSDAAWKIFRDNNNQFFKARFNSSQPNYPSVTPASWHQYGYVKTGTTLYMFLDGIQVNSTSVSATHPVASNSLVFGSYRINDAYSGNHIFNGAIDEIRIYNRVLTQAEIIKQYLGRQYISSEPAIYINSEITQSSQWQYRKAITIDNKNTGALSDYQVKIENPIYDETGLVGSWHFDDVSGSTVPDSSGNNNSGTISGPVWTPAGYHDGAMVFDGSDDYVDVPSITIGSNGTISLWIKEDILSTNKGLLGISTNGYFYLGGGASLQMYNGGSYSGSVPLGDTNWHLVTYTWTGSNYSIYKDDSLGWSGTFSMPTSGTIKIGVYPNLSAGSYFNGVIDEVRIYNRALSPAEIQAYYNAKAKLNYGDLRFINSAGTAELPYWMEKDGTFWIKMSGSDSVPPGLSAIYLYYGNSSAVSTADGAAVFDVFDDFSGTANASPNTSKWDVFGTGIANIQSNQLKLTWDSYIMTKSAISGDFVVEDNVYYQTVNQAGGSGNPLRIYIISQSDTNDYWQDNFRPDANNYEIYRVINGVTAETDVYARDVQSGDRIKHTYIKTGTILKAYFNDTTLTGDLQPHSDFSGANFKVRLGQVWTTLGQVTYVDDIRVRKYTSPEPAVILGSEITPASQWQYRKPITITNSGAALSDYQVKVENPVYNETGLAGSWHFDGASSGIIPNSSTCGLQDTSGNNNNGTASNVNETGMQWTGGKYDGAVKLDGTDDYIILTQTIPIRTGIKTFSIWLYVENGTGSQNVFDVDDGGNPVTHFYVSNGKAAVWIRDNAGNQIGPAEGVTDLVNGWHNVIWVEDTINKNIKAYVDTNLEIDLTNITLDFSTIPEDFHAIGITTRNGAPFGTGFFKGSLDEVRIYNRALSEPEIQAHYNAKAKLNYGDIRFTGNSGTEFPYWMEKDGTFWVKAFGTDSIAGAGDTIINMYYGNTGVSGIGNGSAVFDFFDDFSPSTIDTAKWPERTGVWSISNGELISSSADSAVHQTNTAGSRVMETRVKTASPAAARLGIVNGNYIDYLNGAGQDGVFWHIWGTNLLYEDSKINGSGTQYQYGNFSANVYNTYKIVLNSGTNVKFYQNNLLQKEFTSNVSSANMGVWLSNDAALQVIYDWVFVRKYASSEPAAAVGAETLPYQSAGAFTSSVKTTSGDDTMIDSAAWTTAGSGTITMQVRAGNSDPAGWSDSIPVWEDVDNGDTSIASTGKHLQYRAAFTGSGQTTDPVLTDVTITYTVPIIPPVDSVSCDKLADTWYSTATFTFANNTGFGADINRYYYVWDTNTAYSSYSGTEPQWDTGSLALNAPSDGEWYFHYLPYSSTDTAGIAQDSGPYKFDGTAPSAAVLSAPETNALVSSSTTSFVWGTVTDISGVTYTLQLDNYTTFNSPILNNTNMTNTDYTLNGTGSEVLIGNSTYYWRVTVIDGAGNNTTAVYRKFTTSSSVPQVTNESTGESFATLQDAIDSASTVDGDVVNIKDSLPHQENITITKDITLENGILSPASGFAVTGQGTGGGETLRNCIITSGGISNLALGENLTIFNPSSTAPLVIENSSLINCLIELGTIITNSTLVNCNIEAVSSYFTDAANNDFHLTNSAISAIDQGKNLSTEFTSDADGLQKGVDVLDISNFDTGAWDIGAYEFILTTGYTSGYIPPDSGDNNGNNGDGDSGGNNNPDTGFGFISTEPAGLNFGVNYGAQDVPAKILAIHNSGTTGVAWVIQTDVDWISLSAYSGTTAVSSNVQVTVIPGSLAPSVHTGTIIIASDDAENSPLMIPVTMVIYAVETPQTNNNSNDNVTSQMELTEPLLLLPDRGQLEVYPPPLLMWMPADVEDASYLLQLGADQDFLSLILSTTTTSNTHSTSGMLKYGQTYYWRVKTVIGEQTSDWSETWWFTIKTAEENTGSDSPKTNACFIKKIRGNK